MKRKKKMAEEVQQVDTQVTAGDLATMVRIIDASSQRGAFRGEELETVGALRTKLASIVNALAPSAEETEEGKEETEEESTESVVEDAIEESGEETA